MILFYGMHFFDTIKIIRSGQNSHRVEVFADSLTCWLAQKNNFSGARYMGAGTHTYLSSDASLELTTRCLLLLSKQTNDQ